jgi:hypothetical protein
MLEQPLLYPADQETEQAQVVVVLFVMGLKVILYLEEEVAEEDLAEPPEPDPEVRPQQLQMVVLEETELCVILWQLIMEEVVAAVVEIIIPPLVPKRRAETVV